MLYVQLHGFVHEFIVLYLRQNYDKFLSDNPFGIIIIIQLWSHLYHVRLDQCTSPLLHQRHVK
jgi:hypothetical protein